MKTIKTLVLFVAFFGIAQAQNQFNYDQLPIGKFAVIEKLADATFVEIVCESPSTLLPFRKQLAMKNVQSPDDIKSVITSMNVNLKFKNPLDQFNIKGYVKDANGDVIFQAESYFSLEKKYEGKNLTYEMPEWSKTLYFWCNDVKAAFPNIKNATLLLHGEEYELTVENGGFTMWNGYYPDAHIRIETSTGQTYYYDYNTGKQIPNSTLSFNASGMFQDFVSGVIFDGVLSNTLQPEWNYNPWVEVAVPANGEITLNVLSYYGYQPIGVWVVTLDELRQGQKPQCFKYNECMKVEFTPGSKVMFFFDFPSWVFSIGGGQG